MVFYKYQTEGNKELMGTANKKSDVLIIIPAYNEAENIENIVDEITTGYPQYDYVVVNDGSSDDTARILKRRGYNHINCPIKISFRSP